MRSITSLLVMLLGRPSDEAEFTTTEQDVPTWREDINKAIAAKKQKLYEENVGTAADQIIAAEKRAGEQVTAYVQNIRCYKTYLETARKNLDKIVRATAYAKATGNYIPLSCELGTFSKSTAFVQARESNLIPETMEPSEFYSKYVKVPADFVVPEGFRV